MDERAMESPRKFNDCYFYYYSTCTKGDNCVFRHEPTALGCETMCSLWQQGKCLDRRCKLRHMELRKNRKQIPCYWENQPGGCRKKHCPFMHKNPEARSEGIPPSQGVPQQYESHTQGVCSVPDTVSAEALSGVPTVSAVSAVPVSGMSGVPVSGMSGVPGVHGVPMLWQQQRQVVLDSAILGVCPAQEMVPRRHEPPYPMPVDPLVVKFEEESDGETPSTTPTKQGEGQEGQEPPAENQELLLLQRIQAEAAAYYSYSDLAPQRNKVVRTNLTTKYDRLSLDEITGKKPVDNSLDFKVMSLDEIRAKKRHSAEGINSQKPITLNLQRKRKLSSQETIVDAGNKIIKLVRSNSIVYKKFDKANVSAQKTDKEVESRKRTLSERSDVLEIQDDELEDDCYTFKKVKVDDVFPNKPTLIRTKSLNSEVDIRLEENRTEDSDSEVQLVCEKICYNAKRTGDVIDLDGKSIDIVDLSDDDDEDVVITDQELGLGKSVPDVVASCQASGVLDDIDSLLDEDL